MKLPTLSRNVQVYLIVGISVYVFELLVIVIAQAGGASSTVAVGLSFWSGLLLSFLLQKLLTFQDKRWHRRVLSWQLVATSLLVLWNFGFTLLLTSVLSDRLPAMLCRTLALGITTLWNFYIYQRFIFRRPGIVVD